MSTQFPTLLSPGRIGSLELRNRVVMLPAGTGMVVDGVPTERDLEHFDRLAAGGAGLIITGATMVHPTTTLRRRMLVEAFNPAVMPALEERVRVVHGHGAKIVGQLIHLGRELIGGESDLAPRAPSAVKSPRDPFPPHEMDADEIREIVQSFATCAANLIEAGYDGVEIHGGHGYLVGQFLSPATNFRDDGYGGSFEGRFRFLREVATAMREAIPDEAVLGCRLSADEELPNGLTVDDSCRIAEELAALGGVDYLNVTVGTRGAYVKDAGTDDGIAAPAAARLKAASGLTTIVAQRIRDPYLAESILQAGSADLIGMARQLIVDAQWPQKVAEDRVDQIRPCIGINQECRAFDPHLHCAVNPEVGRPASFARHAPAATATSVFVVGGGPGGLEAARQAALRGHRVTLFERGHELGGQLAIAALAPHRAALSDYVAFMGSELKRLHVDVNLGAPITADDLESMPDDLSAIVLATGSRPVRHELPDGPTVFTVDDVLLDGYEPVAGQDVVVVDDGDGFWPAYNAAEKLAVHGVGVTIVTPAMAAAARLPHESLPALLARLAEHQVRILPLHSVVDASRESVVVRSSAGGHEEELPAHGVVWHAGRSVDDELYRAWKTSAAVPVIPVGDCIAPRRLGHAVLDGYQAGSTL